MALAAPNTHLLFDGTNGVVGIDSTTSITAVRPSIIQVDNMAGATNVKVQARVSSSNAWVDHLALTEANGSQQVVFQTPINYVRVVGLVTNCIVTAQPS
jgi:hypothetical protein